MLSRATGRAERVIGATPERLWQAWFNADELVCWMTPDGSSGRILEFEQVPGGKLRLELSFRDLTAPTEDDATGRMELRARFVSLDPPNSFVFDVPPPPGSTTTARPTRIEWRFLPEANGTRVVVTSDDMPSVNSTEMNAKALGSALPRLAAYVE